MEKVQIMNASKYDISIYPIGEARKKCHPWKSQLPLAGDCLLYVWMVRHPETALSVTVLPLYRFTIHFNHISHREVRGCGFLHSIGTFDHYITWCTNLNVDHQFKTCIWFCTHEQLCACSLQICIGVHVLQACTQLLPWLILYVWWDAEKPHITGVLISP